MPRVVLVLHHQVEQLAQDIWRAPWRSSCARRARRHWPPGWRAASRPRPGWAPCRISPVAGLLTSMVLLQIGIDPFAIDVALLAERLGSLSGRTTNFLGGLLHGDPRGRNRFVEIGSGTGSRGGEEQEQPALPAGPGGIKMPPLEHGLAMLASQIGDNEQGSNQARRSADRELLIPYWRQGFGSRLQRARPWARNFAPEPGHPDVRPTPGVDPRRPIASGSPSGRRWRSS